MVDIYIVRLLTGKTGKSWNSKRIMQLSGNEPFSSHWRQMATLLTVQRHTGLTHPYKFFDIQALWRSGLSTRVPECQKNGGLDQYGAEHFEV